MNDEAALIEKAAQGDSSAYGLLVRRYQDRLFTSILHVVNQREEAEDIVQDAFVQALVKLDSFRRRSSFYTWVYRIAINVALNRTRRKRPEISMDYARETTGADPQDDAESPGDRLLREERAREIQQALARLSEEFRVVLVLREIEGCDYETIAGILEVSIGTVRSRLHRARAAMRVQLRALQQRSPTE